MGIEHRENARRAVLWTGKIQFGDYIFDCQIWNLSLGGARIKVGLPLQPGAEITLVLERYGSFTGTVSWHDAGNLGLQFNQAPESIMSSLGESVVRLGLAEEDIAALGG